MKKSILSTLLLLNLTFPTSALADDPAQPAWCVAETDRMIKSQAAYQKDVDAAQQEAAGNQQPPPAACLGGKLQWERHDMSLHVPQFKTKTKQWSTKVPETKMTTRSFTVARPETKCENKTVGYKPEITCSWMSCTTRMTPIITKICWVETHSHVVKMGVPSVTMRERAFSMSVPEVTLKKQEYSYKYPRFYADEGCIGGGCAKVCEDITQRRVNDQQLALEMRTSDSKREMAESTAANFGCMAAGMQLERKKVADDFENWITVATATRNSMLQQGMNAEAAEQTKVIQAMEVDRDKALKDFDNSIAQIAEEQKKASEIIVSSAEEKI